ncbi:hypothetical protein RB195_012383 [Necator americanus]|uniref:EB domain-containing protein n=1 Tax=Necator americanus TaxID=51031 RepID=A0ABR1D6U3_NECAM
MFGKCNFASNCEKGTTCRFEICLPQADPVPIYAYNLMDGEEKSLEPPKKATSPLPLPIGLRKALQNSMQQNSPPVETIHNVLIQAPSYSAPGETLLKPCPAFPGEPCEPSTECTGGSACVRDRCECPPELLASGQVCVSPAILGLPHRVQGSNLFRKFLRMRGFPMPHPEEWAGVAQSKLASLQGWELVVVVEDSASDILDMDGVHLITFNQHNLPELEFEWGTSLRGYSMKNIGYLYAIKNGAKYIYDAEDSITLDEGAVKMFDYDKTTNGLWFYVNSKMNTRYKITVSCTKLRNENHTNARKRLRLCKERPSSVVQHGLVRGESRAISSDSGIETGADDEFNKFAPHINLAPGVFSAWDSANTLFHYGAFFALFVPVSVTSRSAMVIRSYYIQKLLHLTGASVGIHPPNSVMKRDEETRERLLDDGNLTVISNQMVEFLESWKCNQRRIETCMLALAKEFSDRHLWSEADLAAVSTWIKVLRRLSYKFPKITVENPDCAFVFEENTGGQNCRYVGIDFASSTSRNSAYTNLEIARQRIDAFKSVDEWCTVGGYESNCQYPTPSQLALMHRKDSVLTSNMDTVLVVINNHQRKTGMGLLQRLYQPYFGITIFCGTWNPYEYRDDGQYPEMISPFNYIHLSAAELVQGVFMHYCLAKVRELRLRNVRGEP